MKRLGWMNLESLPSSEVELCWAKTCRASMTSTTPGGFPEWLCDTLAEGFPCIPILPKDTETCWIACTAHAHGPDAQRLGSVNFQLSHRSRWKADARQAEEVIGWSFSSFRYL